MTLLATQYLTIHPKRTRDATMFHLPAGRFVAAQEDDVTGLWDVRVDVGHDSPGVLVEQGLTRAAAERAAHAARLVHLAALDAGVTL